MSVLAIDLGGTGATAEMSETGDIVAVHDNPVTKEANGRSATNAALWAPILARSHARVAFIEWIAARPTDAKVAAFAFGRCRGLAEGICGSLSIPIVWLTPPVWKRLADIPPGAENKDMARTRAIAKWPARAELFKRKCDIDRAEACLIGWAGLQREAVRGR
jgi:crossover junction endodeoxyribonuclease RuvC